MPVGRGIGGSVDGEEPGGVANGAVPFSRTPHWSPHRQKARQSGAGHGMGRCIACLSLSAVHFFL